MMKKILVTGANGQLGNEMRALATLYPQFSFEFTDVQEFDISRKESVDAHVGKSKPQFLVNCAAYTAVDKAETDQELAYLLNAGAPQFLAGAARENDCRYIHVSTDYVFDGMSFKPYSEDMDVKPVSVYGMSKALGEKNITEANADSIIIRTAWLYSSFGNNFVKTMIRLGKEKTDLNVVFDQVGSPTYARDLARCILDIISKADNAWKAGIYHYSNEGVCSWYDFTKEIHLQAGISTCRVRPIETSEYPTPARRPHYSVFTKKKIRDTFGVDVPYWKDSLRECIKLLQGSNG